MKSASTSSRRVRAESQLTSNTPFSQVAPIRAAWDQLVQGEHRPLREQLWAQQREQLRKLTAAATSASSR